MNTRLYVGAGVSLLLVATIFGFDAFSASASSSCTGAGCTTTVTSTITSTTTGLVTRTITNGGTATSTITSTTTQGGATSTITSTTTYSTTSVITTTFYGPSTTVITTITVGCTGNTYLVNGQCVPIPSPVTTTVTAFQTTTVINGITITTTATSTITTTQTTTLGSGQVIPNNCSANGVSFVCEPLTVNVLVQSRYGNTPVANDLVTVAAALACQSADGTVLQSLQYAPTPATTNSAGTVTFSLPAYYTSGLLAGTVPCTGTVNISEATNLTSQGFTSWPTVTQTNLAYVVYLSIVRQSILGVTLGNISPFTEAIVALVSGVFGLTLIVLGTKGKNEVSV